MSFLTPELFDLMVILVIIIGSAFAVVRLYRDFTRPLPPSRSIMRTSVGEPEVPPTDRA